MKAIVLLTLLPLLLGTLIYAMYRSIDIVDVNYRWFPICKSHALPDWFIYSLPDGLYALSLFNLLAAIWGNETGKSKPVITLTLLALIGTEAMQLLGIIPGTLDIVDMLLYAIAYIIVLAIIYSPYKLYTTT